MKERWFLFFDGACPLCFKSQSKLKTLLPDVKLTAVDLNSDIAKQKNYPNTAVVLETPNQIYKGYAAWLKILSHTKYKFVTSILLRPIFIFMYYFISKNRKLLGKLL